MCTHGLVKLTAGRIVPCSNKFWRDETYRCNQPCSSGLPYLTEIPFRWPKTKGYAYGGHLGATTDSITNFGYVSGGSSFRCAFQWQARLSFLFSAVWAFRLAFMVQKFVPRVTFVWQVDILYAYAYGDLTPLPDSPFNYRVVLTPTWSLCHKWSRMGSLGISRFLGRITYLTRRIS